MFLKTKLDPKLLNRSVAIGIIINPLFISSWHLYSLYVLNGNICKNCWCIHHWNGKCKFHVSFQLLRDKNSKYNFCESFFIFFRSHHFWNVPLKDRRVKHFQRSERFHRYLLSFSLFGSLTHYGPFKDPRGQKKPSSFIWCGTQYRLCYQP